MASEELGFAELIKLARQHWKTIGGLAMLSGLLALVALSWLGRNVYVATARLLVYPLTDAAGVESETSHLYRSLLESDSLLLKISDKLVSEGVLPEGAVLDVGPALYLEIAAPSQGQAGSSIVTLTARGDSPEAASRVANAWARAFLEESRSMLRGTAGQTEALLVEQLAPTRLLLEEAESERTRLLKDFQKRQEEIWSGWDQRIAAARKRADRASADFQSETRRLLQEAVTARLLQTTENSPALPDLRTRLLEIVSVRAQLATTPRVLSLEKAASDETLGELMIRGADAEGFDSTLISQEINPLYDQLSLDALRLESELKRIAGVRLAEISSLLSDLEKMQLERGAALTTLREESQLEVRILRRQQSHALQELGWEESTTLAKYQREIQRLGDLEALLYKRSNAAVMTGLFERVELVDLAVPAVPRRASEPRDIPLKVSVSMFLGGLLGLLLALFRGLG